MILKIKMVSRGNGRNYFHFFKILSHVMCDKEDAMMDGLSIVKLSEEYRATTDHLCEKIEELKGRLKISRGEAAFGIEKRIDLLQCEINDMRRICFYIQSNYIRR